MRGPNVFREYWDNPQGTAETLINGWLHTGDVGELDDEGYLKITGRKKDIIITAGGKNLTPSNIENELKQSRFHLPRLVQLELDRANANYAPVEQIKKFTILDHDLSIESGELTPTLKVKRSVINDRYADLFAEMYG
jgi:long-chain acyl-CoA synthetase